MSLIDPSILNSLGFLFNKTCTIQERAAGQDSFGQQSQSWVNKAEHVDIPCVAFASGGQEVKGADRIYAVSTHKIQLKGYFPAITTAMRAVVDVQAYDVLLVESDSQGIATKLLCQIVR